MDKILEFLYYQVPMEYELMFGEARDPKDKEITTNGVAFKKHLMQCSLLEYCQLMIKAFTKTYPDLTSLVVCLLDFDDRGLFVAPDRPRRSKDIKRIDFNYKNAKLYGRFDPKVLRTLEYLDELKVTFKVAQPELVNWVEEALVGKAFNKTTNGGSTTFTVSNSPILKLLVDATSFTIFIDKNSFIEYLFQSRGYDE